MHRVAEGQELGWCGEGCRAEIGELAMSERTRRDNWRSRGWAGFALALVLGALTYAVWLAWDNEYYFDAGVGTYQGPYRPAQLVGCALTFGLVTAALALRWRPVLVGGGTSLGFWLVWTWQAAAQDESGLFIVGSLLLLGGLAAGSALAGAIGFALRKR